MRAMMFSRIGSVLAATVFVVHAAVAAHTATVAISETNLVNGVAKSVTLAFANHANETNGLWVAYGQSDFGTTNGWDLVQFVATVPPETDSLTYALPVGWGVRPCTPSASSSRKSHMETSIARCPTCIRTRPRMAARRRECS